MVLLVGTCGHDGRIGDRQPLDALDGKVAVPDRHLVAAILHVQISWKQVPAGLRGTSVISISFLAPGTISRFTKCMSAGLKPPHCQTIIARLGDIDLHERPSGAEKQRS
jgi:hypothetical protein